MGRMTLRIFPDGRVQGDIQGVKGKTCTNYCRASSIYITINHLLKSGYKDTSLTLAFSLVNSQ